MSTPRISLQTAADTLRALANENPTKTERHFYCKDGQPHCLIGTAFSQLGIEIPERYSSMCIKAVWRQVVNGGGESFPALSKDRGAAEDYLARALFSYVQEALDYPKDLVPWSTAWATGLKKFQQWVKSPWSGFLVQTHGAFSDLEEEALSLMV